MFLKFRQLKLMYHISNAIDRFNFFIASAKVHLSDTNCSKPEQANFKTTW